MELENRRLQQALDALRETNFQETANKILELEKEKKMLTLKLEQMQENCNRFTQQNQELEEMFKNALEENKKLQDAIDNRQQATERQMQDKELDRLKFEALEKQVESLTKEKQRIQNLSVSIQRRADDLERFLDTKKKELESIAPKAEACDRFEIETLDLKEKIITLEKENANLIKDLNKFKATLEVIFFHHFSKNRKNFKGLPYFHFIFRQKKCSWMRTALKYSYSPMKLKSCASNWQPLKMTVRKCPISKVKTMNT